MKLTVAFVKSCRSGLKAFRSGWHQAWDKCNQKMFKQVQCMDYVLATNVISNCHFPHRRSNCQTFFSLPFVYLRTTTIRFFCFRQFRQLLRLPNRAFNVMTCHLNEIKQVIIMAIHFNLFMADIKLSRNLKCILI